MTQNVDNWPQVPTDSVVGKVWDSIMKIAERHALIVQAYGGVATLAMPDEQRKAGLREQVLRMVRMREVSE